MLGVYGGGEFGGGFVMGLFLATAVVHARAVADRRTRPYEKK
jgi:hypothetical protein